MIDIVILILLAALLGLGILLLVRLGRLSRTDDTAEKLRGELDRLKQDLLSANAALSQSSAAMMDTLGKALQTNQKDAAAAQTAQTEAMHKALGQQLSQMQEGMSQQFTQFRAGTAEQLDRMLQSIRQLQQTNEQKLESIRTALTENLKALREENGKKLDEIRGTVDEKLQTTLEKRISESFKTVSEQLEQVYKSMGEMQTIASDVGGLKKVLSGVKTRGILGEIQLGAILEEILAPEQYETNVATVRGSSERVEYAVRLPGGEGQTVYLPIDSKFPGDRYAQLVEAQENGDKAAVEAAYKALEAVIKAEAKDIRDKYISVPDTTNFGIMFLPFEGLYAEVVNHGLVELLQRDYKVNVAGPSTMAAYLNSLQMGFRTLAIQKRSSEVWEVLGAVKTEFDKFDTLLLKMQGHLSQTSKDLEQLAGTRARAIRRKLREVEGLDTAEAETLLELPPADEG